MVERFGNAQNAVIELMSMSCLQRFIRSEHFVRYKMHQQVPSVVKEKSVSMSRTISKSDCINELEFLSSDFNNG
jgi:hypothetical protein